MSHFDVEYGFHFKSETGFFIFLQMQNRSKNKNHASHVK